MPIQEDECIVRLTKQRDAAQILFDANIERANRTLDLDVKETSLSAALTWAKDIAELNRLIQLYSLRR